MFGELTKPLTFDFQSYINELQANPWQYFTLALDIVIVCFLLYEFVKFTKKSRVWQLLKGIAWLIVITILSNVLRLRILNFILTSFMTYGVIALLVIFQPELRRALEQLGSSTFTKMFGMDKSLRDKTKEDIYKVAIATQELAKTKTGALIVFERDIKIQDIIETGVEINSVVSPQLLVNIFVPNTPLHDGAVVIANNQIVSAACILPLTDDKEMARGLGTRHRAAIGISKESDAVVVVVSEETGKVSIAKDGTLIADVSEDALKRILMKHLVTARFGSEERTTRMSKLRGKVQAEKKKLQEKKANRNK
ncbi:tIGR00159 family protein [Clostridium sp. CAG:793]|jgi:diadenylate cyclase|nr:tIGR00159 family protein [Clostridium sp. CAG:793]